MAGLSHRRRTVALAYTQAHREKLEGRFDSEPLFRQWLQALAD